MSKTVTEQLTVKRANAGRKRQGLRQLMKSPSILFGSALIIVLVLLSVISFLGLLPYGPSEQEASERLLSPSARHIFGTDQFGRDVFSRVASGVSNSIFISAVAVVFSTVLGTLGGVVSGYFRKTTDLVVGGFTNILFAFPSLLLALTLAAVFPRTWFTVAIAIAVVYIPIFVRVTRGPVLSLRKAEYVDASKALGMNSISIIWSHIIPNIGGILAVQVALTLSWGVLTEASLSFLGFGTPPPATSLGSMVYDSQSLIAVAPWTLWGPGCALILLIVSLNLIGDGLRDYLDPNRKVR
jgi:peptide/nickel transport system permease protein